jgi:hypothetical protein
VEGKKHDVFLKFAPGMRLFNSSSNPWLNKRKTKIPPTKAETTAIITIGQKERKWRLCNSGIWLNELSGWF